MPVEERRDENNKKTIVDQLRSEHLNTKNAFSAIAGDRVTFG